MFNNFIKKSGKLYAENTLEKIISSIQLELRKFKKEKNPVFYICD